MSLDDLGLKRLVDLLLYFIIERCAAPGDEDADYYVSLDYLYNIFVLWNYMVAVDTPDASYKGWTNPCLDVFEDALRWCRRVYHVPGKISIINGEKQVKGVSLGVDTAFFSDCVVGDIDSRLELLRDDYWSLRIMLGRVGRFSSIKGLDSDEGIKSEIYRLERIKAMAQTHLQKAYEYEKRMGFFDD